MTETPLPMSKDSDRMALATSVETSHFRRNTLIMGLVMLAYTTITVLVIYSGARNIDYFKESQQALADSAVDGASHQIETYLSDISTFIEFYAMSNETVFTQLLAPPKDIDALKKAVSDMREYLPGLYTVSIISRDGRFKFEAELGSVGEVCLRQITAMGKERALAIHPGPEQAHFDILTPLPGNPDMILVAGFIPDRLVASLAAVEPDRHALIVSGSGGMGVELSARGYISQPDYTPGVVALGQPDVLSAKAISGTTWVVSDVPEPGLFASNLRETLFNGLLLLGVALLVISLTVRSLLKRNHALKIMSQDLYEVNSRLRYQTMHDDLTGLANRTLLEDRLTQKALKAARTGNHFLLALANLNEFSRINETLGYEVGDQLLKAVADRLTQRLRDVDTVARFESDVFAIVMDVRNIAEAEFLAAKILDVLQQHFELADTPINIGASIGVSCFPNHGGDVRALVNSAEIALNKVRGSNSKSVMFAADAEPGDIDRLALLSGFTEAMEGGQLFMVYQPKLSLLGSDCHEVEALLRWDHPRFGDVPCDSFIPLVEQTKNILALTHWTVEESLKMQKTLLDQGRKIGVAINLSARVLDDDGFPLWLQRTIDDIGLDAKDVRLELTETAMMQDYENSLQLLLQLAALGVGLSVDDFGVGQSSLAYISRLPVDELKIDKSFISNMSNWESDRAIVKATIDLAHDLGLKVVAEGVETLEQATTLREMDCDALQGYYIARPMTFEQLLHWLARQAE